MGKMEKQIKELIKNELKANWNRLKSEFKRQILPKKMNKTNISIAKSKPIDFENLYLGPEWNRSKNKMFAWLRIRSDEIIDKKNSEKSNGNINRLNDGEKLVYSVAGDNIDNSNHQIDDNIKMK